MPLTTARGAQIGYVEYGKDGVHNVVFLHGFLQSPAIWLPTMRRLPKVEFRCLAFDLPGFGASTNSNSIYSVEGMADSIRHALNELKVHRCSMVANGLGTRIAQSLAARYPLLIYKLILVGARAFTGDQVAALKEAEDLAQLEWTRETLAAKLERQYAQRPKAAFFEKMIDAAMATDRATAAAVARANASASTLDLLDRIQARTLIIQGGKDPSCTVQDAELLRMRIPNARLAVIPKAGHSPMIDTPRLFHARMLGLLREL